MAGRPTDWHWVGRDEDPTPGDPSTLLDWENYFRKRSGDAQDAMYRLRNIQNHCASLDLEGTWITAIWGRCDYLADQLLPERTCHQQVADALKVFRETLPGIQADADYGLKLTREAITDKQHASAALRAFDDRSIRSERVIGACSPADPVELRRRRSVEDDMNDAEGRIRKGKGLVDEAAANFHTAATALIAALDTSVQVLGSGVFQPPPPDRDQSRPHRPNLLRQAVDNELNGLYITASYTAGILRQTDRVGEEVDEMMMFGGPESGGPAGDLALADATMSTSLANSYAFGDDPFSPCPTPPTRSTSSSPGDGWLLRGESWDVDPSVEQGPAKSLPRIFAPSRRHFFAGVRNAGKAAKENTVILPGMNDKVRADLAEIAQGHAECENGHYVVNGRTYGVEPNGTAFPVSGDGFWPMDKYQYKALQQIMLADGNMQKAMEANGRYPPLAGNTTAFAYAMRVYRAAQEVRQ